ncbi:redoxin domain protein [Filimonas lacunae]|nr:redoxin domain protein [Filimonas lacunae]
MVVSATAQNPHEYYPQRPIVGDTVTFQYQPEYTLLKGLSPVTGVIYFYRNDEWEKHDLSLHLTDTGYISRIYLPEGTALIVPVLSAGGKTDRGGKFTYAILCSTKNGQVVSTSSAAWGALRTPLLINKGLVPKIAEDSAYIKPEVSRMWMKSEIEHHPESRRRIFYYAMAILQEVDSARFATSLPVEANYICSLPDVTEKEMRMVSKAYRELAGDNAKAEAVDQLILTRFPNGTKAQHKEAAN